jgi:diaminopimelate epimerase
VHFDKMEGLGNDFVVVDGSVNVDPAMVLRLTDRKRGIGADGLLQVSLDQGSVRMSYWNADGSVADMCGNGLRCAARYAFDRGMVNEKEFEIVTPVGRLKVEVADEPRVELGRVEIRDSFEQAGLTFQRASVGNPHAVTLVANPKPIKVAEIGSAVERSTPGGINVEFVHVLDDHQLELRVWERGVGETLACGSGMVAAAAVTRHLGMTGDEVIVNVPGGVGRVELTGDSAWLSGPVRYVFSGEI